MCASSETRSHYTIHLKAGVFKPLCNPLSCYVNHPIPAFKCGHYIGLIKDVRLIGYIYPHPTPPTPPPWRSNQAPNRYITPHLLSLSRALSHNRYVCSLQYLQIITQCVTMCHCHVRTHCQQQSISRFQCQALQAIY